MTFGYVSHYNSNKENGCGNEVISHTQRNYKKRDAKEYGNCWDTFDEMCDLLWHRSFQAIQPGSQTSNSSNKSAITYCYHDALSSSLNYYVQKIVNHLFTNSKIQIMKHASGHTFQSVCTKKGNVFSFHWVFICTSSGSSLRFRLSGQRWIVNLNDIDFNKIVFKCIYELHTCIFDLSTLNPEHSIILMSAGTL